MWRWHQLSPASICAALSQQTSDEVAEIGGDDAGLERFEDASVAAQVLVRRDAVEPRAGFEGAQAPVAGPLIAGHAPADADLHVVRRQRLEPARGLDRGHDEG